MTSTTGYFRSKLTGDVFDHEIYLGNVDSEDNYEEITKEQYDMAVAEAKAKSEVHSEE